MDIDLNKTINQRIYLAYLDHYTKQHQNKHLFQASVEHSPTDNLLVIK